MYNVKVLQDHPNRSISDIGDKLRAFYDAAEWGAEKDAIDDFAKELAPAFNDVYMSGYNKGAEEAEY